MTGEKSLGLSPVLQNMRAGTINSAETVGSCHYLAHKDATTLESEHSWCSLSKISLILVYWQGELFSK